MLDTRWIPLKRPGQPVLDISEAVDKYLAMTQICFEVELGALEMRTGSREKALELWRKLSRERFIRREERSLVRLDGGAP